MSRRNRLKRGLRTTRTPASACPGCHTQLTAATAASLPGNFSPKPGSHSVCICCRVYLVFKPDMTLRLLTDGEWLALDPGERAYLSRLRDMVEEIKKSPALADVLRSPLR